jgi:putative endonuclease
MSENKVFYVYILSSKSRVLYIGKTNDIKRRIFQHKSKALDGFTKKYNVDRLVYFEDYESELDAINRERQLKGWVRKKKIILIEKDNPAWRDLSGEWDE